MADYLKAKLKAKFSESENVDYSGTSYDTPRGGLGSSTWIKTETFINGAEEIGPSGCRLKNASPSVSATSMVAFLNSPSSQVKMPSDIVESEIIEKEHKDRARKRRKERKRDNAKGRQSKIKAGKEAEVEGSFIEENDEQRQWKKHKDLISPEAECGLDEERNERKRKKKQKSKHIKDAEEGR